MLPSCVIVLDLGPARSFDESSPAIAFDTRKLFGDQHMSEILAEKTCTPFSGGIPLLTRDKAQRLRAPAIVTTILNGRQDADLMLKQLLKPLPALWRDQMKVLKPNNRI